MSPQDQYEQDVIKLRTLITSMEHVYKITWTDLRDDLYRNDLPGMPEQMRDSTGRYILLDAMAAIIGAQVALIMTQRDRTPAGPTEPRDLPKGYIRWSET